MRIILAILRDLNAVYPCVCPCQAFTRPYSQQLTFKKIALREVHVDYFHHEPFGTTRHCHVELHMANIEKNKFGDFEKRFLF